VGVLLLERVFLGFRQRDVLFSFAGGGVAHEVLKARHGKDERQMDDVGACVGDGNSRIGRNEDDGATVHLSDGVSEMDASGSGLQKEDFVGTGVSVSVDFFSWREVFGAEDQVRGAAVFGVNFQKESGSRFRVSGPSPPDPALTFVLFEDEGSCFSRAGGLRFWG